MGTTVRSRAICTHILDRPPAGRSRGRLPRKSDRLSRRHGRPRALRPTMPQMRRKGSANSLCRERNELLRQVPNRRKGSCRPRALPPPGIGLAAHARGTRSPEAPLSVACAWQPRGLQSVSKKRHHPSPQPSRSPCYSHALRCLTISSSCNLLSSRRALPPRPVRFPSARFLSKNNAVLARSGNRTIRDNDPTAHAEIVVLREAARSLGNYRLAGTILYVTLEPCSMCAGAVVQARVPRLVYGADDPRGGAFRSCFEILSNPKLNHSVDVTPGLLAAESVALLQSFFSSRR